jgi:CheY-like chemotaxis protein
MRILIVDDDETRITHIRTWMMPKDRLTCARSAGAAIGILNRDQGRVYDGIMLDHDLFQQRLTRFDHHHNGQDVARTVVRCVDRDVPIFVHSTNPNMGHRIVNILEGAGFDVTRVPFNHLTKRAFDDWIAYVRDAA